VAFWAVGDSMYSPTFSKKPYSMLLDKKDLQGYTPSIAYLYFRVASLNFNRCGEDVTTRATYIRVDKNSIKQLHLPLRTEPTCLRQ